MITSLTFEQLFKRDYIIAAFVCQEGFANDLKKHEKTRFFVILYTKVDGKVKNI
jgi:hypothetical protein